ncbi:hypothetical protein NW768_008414 [Fusarium equiseti]|uniref:Uncharacterized protein n=1 Tax=Fusarium equiseti TaxID=61235 RepID=A0ABQ8R6Y3_FUSEQ|nr:hypothetical protein NW768_008414 [Fusarium equiseti]
MERSVLPNNMRDHSKEPSDNRKRSGESPMEAPPAKRPDRTETMKSELNSIYRQMTSHVRVSFDAVCPDQEKHGDITGICVFSFLRLVLRLGLGGIHPATERSRLIELIKSNQDFELEDDDLELRWGLKEMIKEEEDLLSQRIMQSTLESLKLDSQEASERLEQAQQELSRAEEELAKAMAKKETAVEIRNDLAEALRDVAEADASQHTRSINISQVIDSNPSNAEGLVHSVSLIIGNYTQTRNTITLSRVDKMVEKFEVCVENASEVVSRNLDKEAVAQWEVNKMKRMIEVKTSLRNSDRVPNIKLELIV